MIVIFPFIKITLGQVGKNVKKCSFKKNKAAFQLQKNLSPIYLYVFMKPRFNAPPPIHQVTLVPVPSQIN